MVKDLFNTPSPGKTGEWACFLRVHDDPSDTTSVGCWRGLQISAKGKLCAERALCADRSREAELNASAIGGDNAV
jgi:hypothetical protein